MNEKEMKLKIFTFIWNGFISFAEQKEPHKPMITENFLLNSMLAVLFTPVTKPQVIDPIWPLDLCSLWMNWFDNWNMFSDTQLEYTQTKLIENRSYQFREPSKLHRMKRDKQKKKKN